VNLVALPVLIPLFTAAVLLLVRGRRARGTIAVAGSVGSLLVALVLLGPALRGEVQVVQMAEWAAPFGISLVVDGLSAWMLALSTFVGLMAMVFAVSSLDTAPTRGQGPVLNRAREVFGHHALMQFLFMGVHMSLLTGDIFNLFVSFEVMLVASFGLMLLGGELPELREGFKYVVISLISSALFVISAGLCYGLFGTLNMADISRIVAENAGDPRVPLVGLMLAVVFTTKAAMFPFGFWLPNSYPTPAAATSAYFAAVLTKVGVYALIRAFTLLFTQDVGWTHGVLAWLAGFTMLSGVLGAAAQNEFRKILSFHIISQIGYMIFGLGLFSLAGVAGAVLYIVHHIIVKTTLFLVAGLVEETGGTGRLARVGGLVQRVPLVAVLFLLPALSLAGIPPFSGFVAKLALADAGFAQGQYTVVGVSLLVSLLTLFSMSKIWASAFWGEPYVEPRVAAVEGRRFGGPALMVLATATLAALSIAVAVAAGPLYDLSLRAAEDLVDPSVYTGAVFGP
jgi:multicomponent Na+:H+ antiporter subunit D